MSRLAGKLFAGLFLMCLILPTLAGCNPAIDPKDDKRYVSSPVLYSDPTTGCEYLSTVNANSLTPRIAADGKTHSGCAGVTP
jgi:hypothetical protein